MSSTSGSGEGDKLPELTLIDMLEVFVPGGLKGKVRITEHEPLVGELLRDATGRFFLAPEEDYRGGGMQSIQVHNLSALARRRFLNKVVKLTGIFEDDKGVTVAAIAPVGKPFDPSSTGGRDTPQPDCRKNPFTDEV